MIQVCGFGMCIDQFATGAVSEICVLFFSKAFDGLLAGRRITVVQNDDTVFVARVIRIAGRSDCVQK